MYMLSRFYPASAVLFQLHGGMVSHMQVLATPSSTVHTEVPLKEDTLRKGHCIKYLSIMDKTKSPNFILPINIMRLESLKEDNLYTSDKPLEIILVPKCPLFRDSTVTLNTWILTTKTILPPEPSLILYYHKLNSGIGH